jgi:protein tyrosine phosphatase (PTP) superfamily phosphohydrolase (DUF442 family)
MRNPTLTLLALGTLLACADRASETVVADPTPCTIEGLRNCAEVGNMVIGSQPSQEVLEYLAAQGYETIVSTRAPEEIDWDEAAVVEALGMRFVNIPMPGPVEAISDEQLAAFAEVMEGGEGRMLLHCGSGNRVAGLWGAWLAEYEDVDPAEALRLAELGGMTRVRPVVEQRLGTVAEEP